MASSSVSCTRARVVSLPTVVQLIWNIWGGSEFQGLTVAKLCEKKTAGEAREKCYRWLFQVLRALENFVELDIDRAGAAVLLRYLSLV